MMPVMPVMPVVMPMVPMVIVVVMPVMPMVPVVMPMGFGARGHHERNRRRSDDQRKDRFHRLPSLSGYGSDRDEMTPVQLNAT